MTVRLLTFNIWFSPHEMVSRMRAIGDIIGARAPDVVALQEMTAEHWMVCMQHPAFQGFNWSPPAPSRYYTMIGSARSFTIGPQRTPFRASSMGRDLLAAVVTPRDTSLPALVFGTSHLESLDYAQARRQQAEESINLLQAMASSSGQQGGPAVGDIIFCGDTNINERIDGQVALPYPWKDAWLEAHPNDPGATFDVDRNQMMARMDSWARSNHARLRFDRFWVRLSHYRVAGAELLGEAPLRGETDPQPIWPSDHFGVLLVLEPAEAGAADLEPNGQPKSCVAM